MIDSSVANRGSLEYVFHAATYSHYWIRVLLSSWLYDDKRHRSPEWCDKYLVICMTHMWYRTIIPSLPGAAYMRRWTGSALVQERACRLLRSSDYLNQCWLIVNWTLRNRLQLDSNQNDKFFIHDNSFGNDICEMAAILSRGRWVKAYLMFAGFARDAPRNSFDDWTVFYNITNFFYFSWHTYRDDVIADVSLQQQEHVYHVSPGKESSWFWCDFIAIPTLLLIWWSANS